MSSRVVILGCGYIGIALGRRLIGDLDVVGVRRSVAGIEAVTAAGLSAVRADVTDPDSLADVPDADVVVFAASAGGRGADPARETYVEGQRAAIDHFGSRADPPDRYIYTSSTGVYGDHDGEWVDESTDLDPESERGRVLVEAGRVALRRSRDHGIDGTVARLAGLYGPGRFRVDRYLQGPVTEGHLNMVHRDDVAGALEFFIREDMARGETVLVTDDEPVDRWAFADWIADACGREPPEKLTISERLSDDLSDRRRRRIRSNKRCSNGKLRELGYELTYPSFREGYAEAVEACGDED